MGVMSNKRGDKKGSKAFRQKRIDHYVRLYSIAQLAEMIVDLEDAFEIPAAIEEDE